MQARAYIYIFLFNACLNLLLLTNVSLNQCWIVSAAQLKRVNIALRDASAAVVIGQRFCLGLCYTSFDLLKIRLAIANRHHQSCDKQY